MDGVAPEIVTVPDVVGLPFEVARAVASAAGVSLANPDPDGAPIGAIAWRRDLSIGSQQVPPGSRVTRWSSLRVELVEDGGAGVPAVIRRPSTPPTLSAEAEPEGESI